MNYQRIYNKIINNRKQNTPDVYTEKHHIIPKSLGGSNTKDNIVRLTAREHFICHLLLIRIYKDDKYKWAKMMSAFCRMLQQPQEEQKRYCPSKWYAYMRENLSKAMKINQGGERNSQYGKRWVINPETKQVKSIKQEDLQTYLDSGWLHGKSLKRFKQVEVKSKTDKSVKNKIWVEKTKVTLEQKELNKQKRKQKLLERKKEVTDLYRNYCIIYKEFGWEEFKKQTNYKYSKQNLVMMFKHHLPEFQPQNGKKRGKEFETVYYDLTCVVCGKVFRTKDPTRKVCSTSCNGKYQSTKVWISDGENIKHVFPEELQQFIQQGWYRIKPIGKKGGWDWKRI